MTTVPINFGATVASTPVVMNGEMYFTATNSTTGTQLWESNGTTAGTVQLTNLNDARGGLKPADLTVVGNTLFFSGNDGVDGNQLWSYSTVKGTTMVTDGTDGVAGYGVYPSSMANVNGTLYFAGWDFDDGEQVFESNGTTAGTARVTALNGGNSAHVSELTPVGTTLYFSAFTSTSEYQLWSLNTTTGATAMLTSANAPSSGVASGQGVAPGQLTAVGNLLYFAGDPSPSAGSQLWVSNGTLAGTTVLTSADTNDGGAQPSDLTAIGSTVYFTAFDGSYGYQLWSTTGTVATTYAVTTADASGGGMQPDDLTAIGSTLYFAANDGVHGGQIWSTTGTAASTAMFADINGTTGSIPSDLTDVNGSLYFSAYSSGSQYQLWTSNGTAAGTTQLTSFTGNSQSLSDIVPMGSSIYFTAPATTTPLWAWQSSTSTPAVTWNSPSAITYGTALASSQLDATASVPGTFVYSPAAGTVLKAGTDTLSTTFTPTNTTLYSSVTATTTITVNQATPTISWSAPAGIIYGTALGSSQLDATASVPGTFVYSPASGTVLKAGTDTLSVTFTPTDNTDYASTTATTTINVAKANPVISWSNPAAITSGTALGSSQLDATANVPGTFSYSPASGTVLPVGNNTLSASFTPTDTTDYTTATATTTLSVQGTATGSTSAAFVKQDTTTLGNWVGTYGTQGHDIPGIGASLPSYATVTVSPQASIWNWTTSSTDPRALQSPAGGSNRDVTCWYSGSSFTIDVDLTDGQTHDLELYFLDWDTRNGRAEQVQLSNATTGAVLSTQSMSSFTSGVYLDYQVSGNVLIKITYVGGRNAILNGLFLDPGSTASSTSTPNPTPTTTPTSTPTTSASFVKDDTTTVGNWIGTYGTQGYDIPAVASSLPGYARVTVSPSATWTWTTDSTDPRALQAPGGGPDGDVTCWYSSSSFTVDVDLTDGQTHDLELYFLDWDTSNGRAEQVQLSNATTGTVLSTQSISAFTRGLYLDYQVSGNVLITFTNEGGRNAILNGLFIDPSTTTSGSGGSGALAGISQVSTADVTEMGTISVQSQTS